MGRGGGSIKNGRPQYAKNEIMTLSNSDKKKMLKLKIYR